MWGGTCGWDPHLVDIFVACTDGVHTCQGQDNTKPPPSQYVCMFVCFFLWDVVKSGRG